MSARTLGVAWRHHYDRVIKAGSINGTAVIAATRADGKAYSFLASGSNYVAEYADVTDRLIRQVDADGNTTGWQYLIAADDSIETYDAAGKLLSIRDRNGLIQTLTYSTMSTPPSVAPKTELLLRVTDAHGRQLNFTYDGASRINKMTDPAGGQYLYSYDANNNLISIAYPDNKIRAYRYNEAAYTSNTNLPNALTAVVDENGIRYANYFYNMQGKSIKSLYAGLVNQYQVMFGTNSTTITDPLGSSRTYNYQLIHGVIKTTSQSQPGGSGCGPASNAVTYDAKGNVASRTDFNGIQTTYSYDLTRNLETSRVEAAGTAQARTITTEWHATLRLPIRIAEPLRLTINTYDSTGNLLSKSVQATADTNGSQGFGAPLVGSARTWSYTYNQYGQVLTATGPRPDVADVTSYAYDSQGNLVTITNAANQVTTLSNYDAHGRVGRIIDPNGLITDLTYSPRGWLTSKTVDGELTSYEYDGVGQLKKVNLSDGSLVNYTYDDAHRLTAIADNLGNRIDYTLDAMGNRINEQARDPGGVLARQTTRVYDALNRLQQITGGVQ